MAHPNARVLVVEDDASARLALQKLLEANGYEIRAAEDGVAALEQLAELPADLVVTDLDMPRMGGMELIGALKERHPGLPVIVTTSAVELQSAVAAMRAGAQDYITKP